MPEELNIVMKASDILKKEDFVKSFEQVLDLVMKLVEKHERAIEQLMQDNNRRTEDFKKDYTSNLSELRKQVDNLFVGEQLKRMDSETKANFDKLQKLVNEAVEKKLQEADERVSQLKPIKGDRGDKGDIGPMPTEHLELMKELRGELKKVQNVLSNIPRGKAMGRAKIQIIRAVNLTSQVDGSTTAFTLPQDTVQVLGVFGTQFPINFNADVDWTFAGRTLTLVTSQVGTPQSGQTLWALCEVLFYP